MSRLQQNYRPISLLPSISKIKDQYQYEVAQFMFKYHLKILPVSFDGMFRHNLNIQIEQNTRQHNRLFIERCDPVFASRLPRYNFPKIWNNLNKNPDNLSLNKFKREVKTTILNSYANNVKCKNLRCRGCYNQ